MIKRTILLRCSLSSRIAHKINPIRKEALSVESRFRVTKFSSMSFMECFRIVFGVSVVGFGITTVMDRLSLSSSAIRGWRLLAHLGPYQVPMLVKRGEWRYALDRLNRAEELGLTEAELAQLLTEIEVITQRRQAVRDIVENEGFEVFLPVLKNLSSGEIYGQSHFESNLRVAMDVVCATPARSRRVPKMIIEDLVSKNKTCWESKSNEEVMRFREYRALLLLKLMQNEDNAIVCRESKIIREFLINEEKESAHVKYSTFAIIPFFYQFKIEKLGYEFSDILYRIERALDSSDERRQQQRTAPQPVRKSLKLDHKLDYQNIEKLVYMGICYSSLRYLPLISEYSLQVMKGAVFGMMRSVIGASILDLTYRGEEHVIQSKPYYETSNRILGSALIVLIHSCVAATVLRRFPFSFVPFAFMRARDSFTDSYRFI